MSSRTSDDRSPVVVGVDGSDEGGVLNLRSGLARDDGLARVDAFHLGAHQNDR